MEPTASEHRATVEALPTRSGPSYRWTCTCGVDSDVQASRFSSRRKAVLNHARHVGRILGVAEPEHSGTLKPEGGVFGGPSWSCSCGAESRPEGYQNQRRARQGFTSHVTKTSLVWYLKNGIADGTALSEGSLGGVPVVHRAPTVRRATPTIRRATDIERALDELI